jgi:hypothetical protein
MVPQSAYARVGGWIVGAALSASGIGSMVGRVAVRLRMRAVIASAAEALRLWGRSGVTSMVCDDFRAWMRSANAAAVGCDCPPASCVPPERAVVNRSRDPVRRGFGVFFLQTFNPFCITGMFGYCLCEFYCRFDFTMYLALILGSVINRPACF